MTREEAIERLNIHKSTNVFVDSIAEAIDMAIEALQNDAVQGEWIVREYCTNELDYRRWIEIECPFCGEKPTYEDLDNMNYCPNCGARMEASK